MVRVTGKESILVVNEEMAEVPFPGQKEYEQQKKCRKGK